MKDHQLAGIVTAEGHLYNLLPDYIEWNPALPGAILEGLFSAARLRAIADHMDMAAARQGSLA